MELRPLTEADSVLVHAYVNENHAHMAPWEPLRPAEDFTIEGVRRTLARSDEEREADRAYAFGVFDETGTLVGRIGLSNVSRGAWQSCTVGYSCDHRHQGRGIATEAVRLVVRFAFEAAALHRIVAAIMPENLASIRVVERNGFREEGFAPRYLEIAGRWRDHRLFALTVEDLGGSATG